MTNQPLKGLTILNHFDLSRVNTFAMKVWCDKWIEYDSVAALLQALACVGNDKFMHIGAGSNILFTTNFNGTILHSKINTITTVSETDSHITVRVGSGVVFDDLIFKMCKRNIWGIENLSGIPGEVGASAVQNVGAYGVEAKDVISEVECIDTINGSQVTFSNAECRYGYRDSRFKHEKNRYIVTYVTFTLSKIATPQLNYGNLAEKISAQCTSPLDVRNAVIEIRNKKLPKVGEIGSAGSFFKNPVVDNFTFQRAQQLSQRNDIPFYTVGNDQYKIPAAWLIEQCGWKGKTHGNAAVWHLQPLVLVNNGNASADEIIALKKAIINSVEEKFGLTLHPEVEHV
jgi:UDP-N-acetylmuramate dehydrogenase